MVHNIIWRTLLAEFDSWNSVRKRFWRLSRTGVFEAFIDTLAKLSGSAHLVQVIDSTSVRAYVSAAGANGSRTAKHSSAAGTGSRPISI